MLTYLNKWQIAIAIVAVIGMFLFWFAPAVAFTPIIFMFGIPLIMLLIHNDAHYAGSKKGEESAKGHPALVGVMELDKRYTVLSSFRGGHGHYLVIKDEREEPILLEVFGEDLKKVQPGQTIVWTVDNNRRLTII